MSLVFAPVLPEIVLAAVSLVLVLLGALKRDKATTLITLLGVMSLVFFAFWQVSGHVEQGYAMGGAFIQDAMTALSKGLIAAAAAVILLMSAPYMRAVQAWSFEFTLLVLLSCLGMFVMVSAADMLTLYVGLELQSLALYVLAAYHRDSARASEAGLKYFVLGALSSGMLLYGMSMLYGATGSLSFTSLAITLKSGGQSGLVLLGLVLVLIGMAFKVSAVPFHMWTPDVYEGAPTPVTAFFAAVPKLAAMVILMRVLGGAFGGIKQDWQQILWALSLGSMLVGAFGAIGQTSIKRLMAYSSIGHMGYVLLALSTTNSEGFAAAVHYMIIYVITSLGVFAVILALNGREGEGDSLRDYAGLAKRNPMVAFAMGCFLFSLAGIPLLAGFFAKFQALLAVMNAGLIGLAIVGVLASVISAFYYLRIVKLMYVDAPAIEKGLHIAFAHKATMMVACIAVLAYILVPQHVMNIAALAVKPLF